MGGHRGALLLHFRHRGVADIFHLKPLAAEIVLLEGEDGKDFVAVAAHLFYAPFFPRPDFRGDKVEDGYSERFGEPGQFQVEGGVVDKHQGIGTLALYGLAGGTEVAGYRGEMAQDFGEAHVGHVAVMDQRREAGCLRHHVSSQEGHSGVRGLPEKFLYEVGSVEVAGGFSGRDEESQSFIFHR